MTKESEMIIGVPYIQVDALRDYFAGQAMAAIISKIPFQEYPEDWSPYNKTAIGAYDYADAMLTARERTTDAEG